MILIDASARVIATLLLAIEQQGLTELHVSAKDKRHLKLAAILGADAMISADLIEAILQHSDDYPDELK